MIDKELDEEPTYHIDGIVFDSWDALNAYCNANAPAIKEGDKISYDLHLKSGDFYETVQYFVVEIIDERRWMCYSHKGGTSPQGYDFLYRLSKKPNFKITSK
jgi:hypothetical protein